MSVWGYSKMKFHTDQTPTVLFHLAPATPKNKSPLMQKNVVVKVGLMAFNSKPQTDKSLKVVYQVASN